MKALLFTLLLASPAFAALAHDDDGLLQDTALSGVQRCQDEARIQNGFQPGENANGVCSITFTGSRVGTRTCPGTLVFWSHVCRFEGTERGQTCCE